MKVVKAEILHFVQNDAAKAKCYSGMPCYTQYKNGLLLRQRLFAALRVTKGFRRLEHILFTINLEPFSRFFSLVILERVLASEGSYIGKDTRFPFQLFFLWR